MKICPYCAAQNRDESAACFFCGSELKGEPFIAAPPSGPGTTEPVHVRRPDPPVTGTQVYTPPVGDTQPRSYTQPSTASRPAYSIPQPAVYPMPGAQPLASHNPLRRSSRLWPVLWVSLGLLFVFACGLAAWTISAATTGGVNRLRAQLSTQAAQIFPAAGVPQPTSTPQPEIPVIPVIPDETQESNMVKLLSPECAGALDNLSQFSDQIKTQPTIPLDSAWREDITQAVADMRTYCGSLDSASPVPQRVADAHHDLTLASEEFDQANQLFKEGVDELNPGKILEAGKHVRDAANYLNQAMTELKKIGE